MRFIKYLLQFIFIGLIFIIFRIIGLKLSRSFGSKIFLLLGPFFRSKKIIEKNLLNAFSEKDELSRKIIINNMWKSYGKIFAEYLFIKYFREDNTKKYIEVKGQEILDKIKTSNEPVIFISGHFDNFELMAMHIERSGVDLAAIYRPLNNYFLNPIMETIRKKYICHKQIKKGISGTKEILKYYKSGTSVALMIDQRVSEGIRSSFFQKKALTTTIPAQFVKKFKCNIVPIHIERKANQTFLLEIMKPLNFDNDQSIENITLKLNQELEKMIIKNPHQWIWSHNRWK